MLGRAAERSEEPVDAPVAAGEAYGNGGAARVEPDEIGHDRGERGRGVDEEAIRSLDLWRELAGRGFDPDDRRLPAGKDVEYPCLGPGRGLEDLGRSVRRGVVDQAGFEQGDLVAHMDAVQPREGEADDDLGRVGRIGSTALEELEPVEGVVEASVGRDEYAYPGADERVEVLGAGGLGDTGELGDPGGVERWSGWSIVDEARRVLDHQHVVGAFGREEPAVGTVGAAGARRQGEHDPGHHSDHHRKAEPCPPTTRQLDPESEPDRCHLRHSSPARPSPARMQVPATPGCWHHRCASSRPGARAAKVCAGTFVPMGSGHIALPRRPAGAVQSGHDCNR